MQSYCKNGLQIKLAATVIAILAVVCGLDGKCGGEIATDGTFGPAMGLGGPHFQIGADIGAIRGANLFHSFRIFSIRSDESATFSGPDSIQNVISRVTGKDVSIIDGLLRSEVGNADFFFINPAGVVFGPNARVEVPAAFHAGTADELRFEDGTVFNATDAESSCLSAARPEAFGFLSPQPASVVVNGSRLEFAPDSRVTLGAGDVVIQSGASLAGEGGGIQIAAVGALGDAVFFEPEKAVFAGNGTVAITGASSIEASGNEGTETIELRGGHIEIVDSLIAADHYGDTNSGGKISINARSFICTDSEVRAAVFGIGRGNDIVVVAEDFDVVATSDPDGLSRLTTRVMPEASGAAGNILIETSRMSVNGGQLSSIIANGAIGHGGMVEVRAKDSISIYGSGGIFTTTLSDFAASGGTIRIDSPSASFRLAEGGLLQSGSTGAGEAGDIIVTAHDVEIADCGIINSHTLGTGNAGSIKLETSGDVTIIDSYLFAGTESKGGSGSIDIESAGSVEIIDSGINSLSYEYDYTGIKLGNAGRISIKAEMLTMLDSSIDVSSHSWGNAGSIEVVADKIDVRNDGAGTVDFNASNFSQSNLGSGSELVLGEEGRSGTVELTAREIIFDNDADISIYTSAGDGGSITVRAEDLSLLNGSDFLASTLGPGKGGDVDIRVSGNMLVEGKDCSGMGSSIRTGPFPLDGMQTGENDPNVTETGPSGNIEIAAESLVVGQDGEITSGSFSDVPSGRIFLDVGSLEVRDGGEIISNAFAEGPGGEIVIIARDTVTVHGYNPVLAIEVSKITSDASFSGTDKGGRGGSILINSPTLTLEHGGVLSAETGCISDGGTIYVRSENLVIRSGGEISTSTFGGGCGGNIDIIAGSISISSAGTESLNRLVQETGLLSRSSLGTAGDAGNISIMADSLSLDGCDITIASYQALPENQTAFSTAGLLRVDADEIRMNRGASITAESTGNVSASAVEIGVGELLLMQGDSRITTESQEADGGPVSIFGGDVVLRDSQITTSVKGLNGDGGNIDIEGNALVLQGGFIQANTAADDASGGDISIDAALVASNDFLEIGGTEELRFQPGSGLNIIQAAAPGGVRGTITLNSPELDIGETLVTLSTPLMEAPSLITDPCVQAAGKASSSLILLGKGGMPAGPEEPASVFFGGQRLNRLIESEADDSTPVPSPRSPSREGIQ